MKTEKRIIDVCCGSKMFWFNKDNPDVEFCDKRVVPRTQWEPGRYIEVKPDTVCDFTKLPFPDESFYLVVFDPPHLLRAGTNSWLNIKYGCLSQDWAEVLHDGFWECWRVLKRNGTLIFKWNETDIPLCKVLEAIKAEPLFGHKSGKAMNTHWLCFLK